MNCVNVWPDGSAIAYENIPKGNITRPKKTSEDKAREKSVIRFRRMQCAITLMAQGRRTAIFFTVTCAGVEGNLNKIALLFNLMRNAYGLTNYVWVRELTRSGREHFHVAAQFRDGKHSRLFWQASRKAVQLSQAWAKINGTEGNNSIRFGWNYIGNKAKKWYIDKGSARYMAKYLSKSELKHGRKCQLSQKLSNICVPARYQQLDCTYTKHTDRNFQLINPDHFIDRLDFIPYRNNIDDIFLKKYSWKLLSDGIFFCYSGQIMTDFSQIFDGFSQYLKKN